MEFIFDNDRPIYIQLVEQLEIYIVSGKIKPGSRLPSVREFALDYKVNPNTMQRALMELENLGLIYTERTNGKYVTDNQDLINSYLEKHAKDMVRSYLEGMQQLGFDKKKALQYLNKMEEEKEWNC